VFRHVRLAFLVLLIDAALFVLTPPNPARSFFGVAALLATGYCALDLLVGTNDRLRLPEIAAFSVGLGILVTGAAALVMWGFGVPLTEGTILLFGLPIALLAMLGTPPAPRRRVVEAVAALDDLPGYTAREKLAGRALLVAVFVALAVVVGMAFVEVPDTLSPGLALTGPNGTPESLPQVFPLGSMRNVTVSVFGGAAAGQYELRIRLVPATATGGEVYHSVPWTGWSQPLLMDSLAEATITVVTTAGGTVENRLEVVLLSVGEYDLRFEVRAGPSTIVTARLPVTVR